MSSDFENGGSWLMSEKNYDRYVRNHDYVGREDGQFVIPSNLMNELLDKYPNNPREWEKILGLNENSLGDNPYRIDVYEPQKFNLREPTSNMSGANDKFIAGAGKTSGGIDEGVINPVPNPEKNPQVGKIQRTSDYYKGESSTEGKVENITVKSNGTTSQNIAASTGGGSNAPPSDTHKSDSSDKKTMDYPKETGSQENKFTPVKQEDISGKERVSRESFSRFSEDDLAKRNEMKAGKGADTAVQNPTVNSGLNGSDKKANGTGMGV